MNNEKLIMNNKEYVGADLVSAQTKHKNNATPVGASIARLFRKNQGITLIALIITIIVMLILAGVVLNLTIGERGIFNTAKQSKIEYIIAEMKEELELALNDLRLEKQGNATLDDVTQDWADSNKLKEYNTVIEDDPEANQKTATMTKDGVTGRFVIDEKLNIIEGEQIAGNEQYQTITLNLEEGISIDNKKTKTALNKPYNATITAQGEYVLETLTVTMGGQPVTVDISTGKISIENVTGDIEITATAKKLNLQITEPIIGTTTIATSSVNDNSQTIGTKLYINFSATLEGQNCTITYKEDDTKTVPFEITKNGKYVFVITGTYNGKKVTKEKEVEVNKYQSATGLVKYDAGEWTKEEIKNLQNQLLYDMNASKAENITFKLNSEDGLNFTFGGFTFKGDTTNAELINAGTVITSRNQSVAPQRNYGVPKYEGWQIFESEEKEVNGEKRTYVTKLIHAGSSENFVFHKVATTSKENFRAEYLLSNGTRQQTYNTLSDGTEINPRNWDMYKDKELDAKGYIENVHIMTYDEAKNSNLRTTGAYYHLATARSGGYEYLCRVKSDGGLTLSSGMTVCWGIRPVVSLNEGVYIASGSGTEADPYVLAKE